MRMTLFPASGTGYSCQSSTVQPTQQPVLKKRPGNNHRVSDKDLVHSHSIRYYSFLRNIGYLEMQADQLIAFRQFYQLIAYGIR